MQSFLQYWCCYATLRWKNQVESSTNFSELEKDLDSIGLLSTIKKLIYTGGTNDLNIRHNKAKARMNRMNLYKVKFQDIQEFRYQYIAMQKVSIELDLKLIRWTDDAKAVLKEKGITELTSAQLKKAVDK